MPQESNLVVESINACTIRAAYVETLEVLQSENKTIQSLADVHNTAWILGGIAAGLFLPLTAIVCMDIKSKDSQALLFFIGLVSGMFLSLVCMQISKRKYFKRIKENNEKITKLQKNVAEYNFKINQLNKRVDALQTKEI